jgi:hypothetical protein
VILNTFLIDFYIIGIGVKVFSFGFYNQLFLGMQQKLLRVRSVDIRNRLKSQLLRLLARFFLLRKPI